MEKERCVEKMNMRATVYGVGVGPGDPELMTVKAVRLIRENEVIAVPGTVAADSAAWKIAAAAVPEITEKTLVPVPMPMTGDRQILEEAHRQGARLLEEYLSRGKNVVYLTLGDPTIFSTFTYLQRILEEDGYPVELVSGVPSFCAAAARLNIPLAEGTEQLHIVPAGSLAVSSTISQASSSEESSASSPASSSEDFNTRLPEDTQSIVSGSVSASKNGTANVSGPISDEGFSNGIVPVFSTHTMPDLFTGPGNYVLMKSAGNLKAVKELLRTGRHQIFAVEKCGMEGEQVYQSVEEIPEDAGYFTLIIVKDLLAF